MLALAIAWNCFMWFQRSACWIHGMSLAGVSLTWASHCADVIALALAGTASAAAAHNGNSHDRPGRELGLLRIAPLPSSGSTGSLPATPRMARVPYLRARVGEVSAPNS